MAAARRLLHTSPVGTAMLCMCVGYTLVWDINNVPLPLLQIRCFFHSMRYTFCFLASAATPRGPC
uniref:Uncharacterized protein n=1 Tax=Oryza barthii TaxID=65489 RepID=A0A0D3EV18_9ORYZ